jgi:Uma2 family endonuclease
MATRSSSKTGMTLEEFLQWPRIDEKPYLEYYDGRIEPKMSPKTFHSVIQDAILDGLNRVARPSRIGQAFPELRCTFAGLSIVPDVVFLLDEHIEVDARGRYMNDILIPPDIHVEIRSPGQSIKKSKEKLAHSIANGCPLGWFLDPDRETIDVFRPGLTAERLPVDGFLDASPILPGFRVAVDEVFGWLIYRKPGADPR